MEERKVFMVERILDRTRSRPQQPMNEEDDYDYQVSLRIEDIHLLHHCVLKRLETWEGSPSRHPTEQEHLWYLRDSLYRMILEYKFENL